MKQKFEKGGLLLCYSPHHVEKSSIINISGGVITLNNQVKVDKFLNILNSRAKGIKVEEWDQDKYDYLVAKSMMDKVLYKINSKYQELEPENLVRVYEKLNRLVDRYF